MAEAPPESVLLWHVRAAYRGIAIWYYLTSVLCLLAPDYWAGPTWRYFQQIPHGAHGLGLACLGLGAAMTWALGTRNRRLTVWCLGAGATAFWVAALIIFVQGLLGKTGLFESWFMTYVAVDIGLYGATLAVRL